jgi:hypothetical protein
MGYILGDFFKNSSSNTACWANVIIGQIILNYRSSPNIWQDERYVFNLTKMFLASFCAILSKNPAGDVHTINAFTF